MTLTEAQPKRDKSLTESHCCAFCCAPLAWVDPFLNSKASPVSKSTSSLYNFSTAKGSTDLEKQDNTNEKVQDSHKF